MEQKQPTTNLLSQTGYAPRVDVLVGQRQFPALEAKNICSSRTFPGSWEVGCGHWNWAHASALALEWEAGAEEPWAPRGIPVTTAPGGHVALGQRWQPSECPVPRSAALGCKLQHRGMV